MPSNFTTNFNLSQWEADDKVLRSDFNADNAKIDAALNLSFRRELIMEVTAEEEIRQLEMDVSDLNWEAYQMVIVKVVPCGEKNPTVGILMNNGDITASSAMLPGSGTLPDKTIGLAQMSAPAVCCMFPLRSRNSNIKVISFSGASIAVASCANYIFSQVETIQVDCVYLGSNSIQPGSKAQLWGIK